MIKNVIDPRFITRITTSDQAVNNSIAVVAIPEFAWPVPAGSMWVFDIYLFFNGWVASDLRLGFDTPAGAVGRVQRFNEWVGNQSITTAFIIEILSNGDNFFSARGVIDNPTNPGNITLGFAQGTAVVEDTIILEGSTIVAYRVK